MSMGRARATVRDALERRSEQLSALGHPQRLSIVRLLVRHGDEGVSAGDIQSHVAMPASTLSHHLKRLSTAGLIVAREDGTFVFYRPNFGELRDLTDYLWEDCCKGGKTSRECC
jgi:DNA-binding transcriptional ArsR family regulator